jgi:hypothetical protein
MSSDSSSVKEDIKKDEKEDDKDNNNLLKVKKKRAPMIRLNSKPVLTMLSSNNLNVSKFKEKLEEGLKQQFDELLNEIKQDIENQDNTPVA